MRTKVTELREARNELIHTTAGMKGQMTLLNRDIAETKVDIAEYDKEVEKYAELGEHSKGKMFLNKKLNLELLLPQKEQFLKSLEANYSKAKKSLDNIEYKLQEIKIKQTQLELQTRLARANNSVASTASSNVLDNVDEILKDAELKALTEEYSAELIFDYTEDLKSDTDLEAAYAKYVK